MSTNISDLIYEMECYGVPKNRANEIAADLLVAGERSVSAALGELAGERDASPATLRGLCAGFVLAWWPGRIDVRMSGVLLH